MKESINTMASHIHELEAELVNSKQKLADALNNAYELENQNLTLKTRLHQDGVPDPSPPTKK